MTQDDHNAVDSNLGYIFQTLEALIILLQAADDESVSIELTDDVTLHRVPRPGSSAEIRYQVAHSTNADLSPVTTKATKLWKTLRIWASEYTTTERYFLLTCAPVSTELLCLTMTADRTALLELLEREAALVIEENRQGIHDHKARIAGCKAFTKLPPEKRAQLIEQITLVGSIPNINAVDVQLDGLLRPIVRPERRARIICRIREYWMNRACLSLTGELPRKITKAELQSRIEEINSSILSDELPNDYGAAQPPLGASIPETMRRQIELVKGGPSRITRASAVHWKSRSQREKWLADDISIASRLNEFDRKLVDVWNDRHAPMCDDTQECEETEKQRQGRAILDWSHNDAPQWPTSLGRGPLPDFVIQGTYQDLANQLEVGWHPEYKTRLKDPGDLK